MEDPIPVPAELPGEATLGAYDITTSIGAPADPTHVIFPNLVSGWIPSLPLRVLYRMLIPQ